VITQINTLLEENKAHACACGKENFWERDKKWVETAQSNIMKDDSSSLMKVLDEMRNLSQSFGAYLPDLNYLDKLLDDLFSSLREDVLRIRSGGDK